jgi:hypothetical protein
MGGSTNKGGSVEINNSVKEEKIATNRNGVRLPPLRDEFRTA